MGNRIIKESVCASSSIDTLAWDEEVFFYRLLVNCDDFGRADGRPPMIKSRLFPLRGVSFEYIERCLTALESENMIAVYYHKGQRYIQVVNWEKHQTIRNKKSKFPDMNASDGICNQLKSIEINCGSNPIQSESEYNTNSTTTPQVEEVEENQGDSEKATENVIRYCQDAFIHLTPRHYEEIQSYYGDGITDEMMRYAIDTTVANGSKAWAYASRIIQGWVESGIKTIEAAKQAQLDFKARRSKQSPPEAPYSPHRRVDDDDD